MKVIIAGPDTGFAGLRAALSLANPSDCQDISSTFFDGETFRNEEEKGVRDGKRNALISGFPTRGVASIGEHKIVFTNWAVEGGDAATEALLLCAFASTFEPSEIIAIFGTRIGSAPDGAIFGEAFHGATLPTGVDPCPADLPVSPPLPSVLCALLRSGGGVPRFPRGTVPSGTIVAGELLEISQQRGGGVVVAAASHAVRKGAFGDEGVDGAMPAVRAMVGVILRVTGAEGEGASAVSVAPGVSDAPEVDAGMMYT